MPLRLPAAIVLGCGLLVACGITLHPLPPGPRPTEVWDTAERPPRAVILALHGFNDYRHAFAGFAGYAAARGYHVEAFDQQGFGGNANRGLWPGRAALVEDIVARLTELRQSLPDTPLLLLGESMGAAAAVVAVENGAPPIDGLILISPAIWDDASVSGLYRVVLDLAAGIAPGWTVTGRGLGIRASDNDEALIALGRDPMVIKETRLDAIAGLVQLMDEAWQAAGVLKLPVLILMGEHDEVIAPESMRNFTARVDPAYCHAVAYAEGWHLLLRDLEAEKVWRDILTWIESGESAWPCPAVVR